MSRDLLGNFRSGSPSFRQSPFGYTGGDPGQLFADLGGGINPSGFTSNVDNAPATVIINEDGITVTDGAIVVTNPSATVIIDGTSNMFKIAATGTTSVAVGTSSGAVTDVTLTGLGALATTPAHLSMIAAGNTTGESQNVGSMFLSVDVNTWLSQTSGGATNFQTTAVHGLATMNVRLNGSSEVVVRIEGYIGGVAADTFYGRYYVLQEAAL